MAFGTFQTLQEVLQTYQIQVCGDEFVQLIPLTVNSQLRERLAFFKVHAPLNVSEEAICEFLIAPILQEMWLLYADALTLWSHAHFGEAAPLKGFPDYFFTRRSPLGRVMDQPYVLFIEAKSNDFDAAWAQCLAAMLAAQKLNAQPRQVIHGSVSSGEVWYFGKLEGTVLTQDPRAYTITHLEELFAALHYLFEQAKQQALANTEPSHA
jgi:hypothetical protein